MRAVRAWRRDGDRNTVIGGSVWSGFTHIMKSPYLLGICLFMLFYVFGSTILYFAQSDLVGKLYADRTARTAVLAQIELAVAGAHRHDTDLLSPAGSFVGSDWR